MQPIQFLHPMQPMQPMAMQPMQPMQPMPLMMGVAEQVSIPSLGKVVASRAQASPRAQESMLRRVWCETSQVYRLIWRADARKLKTSDNQSVSPPFELCFTREVQFKLVIQPHVQNGGRGGASFKKANGKGSVLLRCLDEVTPDMNPVLSFRILVGSPT